jgi:thiol-disulfide isomerase/thioredoxin
LFHSCSEKKTNLENSLEIKVSPTKFFQSEFYSPVLKKKSTFQKFLEEKDLSKTYKSIYLHFWATWCAPCLTELPKLVNFIDTENIKATSSTSRILLVLIAVDDSVVKIMDFLRNNKLNDKDFVLLIDSNEESYLKFGVVKVPETFIFNLKGQLIRKYIGPQDWALIP